MKIDKQSSAAVVAIVAATPAYGASRRPLAVLRQSVFGLRFGLGLTLAAGLLAGAGSAQAVVTRPDLVGSYDGKPDGTWDSVRKAGLRVSTFRQPGLKDPSQTFVRRYLQYIPPSVARDFHHRHPVVIAMHGANLSAETFREFDMGSGRLERLADKEKFIVIYANAAYAPGVTDDQNPGDPYWANGGYWRTCLGSQTGPDFVVDDVDYLRRVIQNAQNMGVSIDRERIYLMGASNGGEMVQRASREMGNQLAGAGVVIPVVGMPATVALGSCTVGPQHPVSTMFIYSPKDPLLAPIWENFGITYADHMSQSLVAWRQALGINESSRKMSQLPNTINEGADYTGSVPWALATRNSSITRHDFDTTAQGVDFSVLEMVEAAGHGWPNTLGSDVATAENPAHFGFRNQDIDAEQVLWDFLKTKQRVVPASSCLLSYRSLYPNQHFVDAVTLTNTGSTPIKNWNVVLTYNKDLKLSTGFNAKLQQKGRVITASSLPSNSTIASKANVLFGIVGSYSGTRPLPTASLDGHSCAVIVQ